MYLSWNRKFDYASFDKCGNPTSSSRYFKFRNIEIRINPECVNIMLYINEDYNKSNTELRIDNGKFQIDNKNDRLIISVIKIKNKLIQDERTNDLYVSISYYENNKTLFDVHGIYYYIIAKYAYDLKGKWVGINRNDIDNFYNIIKYHTYININVESFGDIVKEYDLNEKNNNRL